VSPSPWLAREIYNIFFFILQKCSRHVALLSQFSISAIEASFELPSSRGIHRIVFVIIIDHSASIASVFPSIVVAVEVVAEQIDAGLIFSHFVRIVKVLDQIIFGIQSSIVVQVVALWEDGR
jgi:hypothetical protein